MSYEILYGKQFIKLGEDKFIPMILTGSNNCYEVRWNGKQVRERNWHRSGYFSNGKVFPSAQDILTSIDNFRNTYIDRYSVNEEKYTDDAFGYFTATAMYGRSTRTTTFGQFKSFYQTGIKQAMTVEELKEFRISLRMTVYYYNEKELTDKGLEIKPDVYFENTEDIEKTYNEWAAYYGEQSERIAFKLNADEDDLKRISKARSNKKAKREKQRTEVDSYWVIEICGGYYTKSTSRAIKYNYTAAYAKKFATEKQANDFVKKFKYKDKVTAVTEIKEKTILYI